MSKNKTASLNNFGKSGVLKSTLSQAKTTLCGINDNMIIPTNLDIVKGYEPLANVLVRALEQSQNGKGKERHANDNSFLDQPICTLQDLYGKGFALGQAAKKMHESQRLPHEMAVKELLGAIVYIAATIIKMEDTTNEASV